MSEELTRDEVPESKFLFAVIGGMAALVSAYMVALVAGLTI